MNGKRADSSSSIERYRIQITPLPRFRKHLVCPEGIPDRRIRERGRSQPDQRMHGLTRIMGNICERWMVYFQPMYELDGIMGTFLLESMMHFDSVQENICAFSHTACKRAGSWPFIGELSSWRWVYRDVADLVLVLSRCSRWHWAVKQSFEGRCISGRSILHSSSKASGFSMLPPFYGWNRIKEPCQRLSFLDP